VGDYDIDYIPPKRVKGTEADIERGKLRNIAGSSAKFPTLQVPGMTAIEQQAQSVLGNLLAGGTFQDPSTSLLYQGLRRESEREEEKGAGELRRFAQLGGMGQSSRAIGMEGDYRANMANRRSSLLGSLYNQERARDNPYTRLAAVAQYGGLPREIQGQRNQAEYQKMIQDLLFPYTTQAGLLQQIIGNEQWYKPMVTADSGGGWTDMIGSIAGIAGTVLGGPMGGAIDSGIGSLFSKGGGGSGGGVNLSGLLENKSALNPDSFSLGVGSF